MTMKLYAREGSFRAQKIIVAAQYAGASLDIVTGAKESDIKGKAAANRLPMLETDKGCLFTSNAAMKFVAAGKSELVGKDAFEQAQIESWVDFCANEIEVPATMATYPIIGWTENSPEVTSAAVKALKSALAVLEDHLKTETFLVGRSITLADIAIAAALVLPMKFVLDAKARKQLVCVTRWFETCVNQTNFLKVIGPVTMCKTAVKSLAEPKKAGAAAPKAEAPKEEAPKKEEKADPVTLLGKLPKSDFVMDAWKRQYSNARNPYDAMNWLWENLDTNGWSIWVSKYKFNEELKVDFQTSNLAGGFCQRLDAVRKYLFGTLLILGTKDSQQLEGCWLFRGDNVDAIIDSNPDAEYHDWIKMELNDKNKAIIAEYWCSEADEVTGVGEPRGYLDCKVFK
ncbi:Elongation factor 1-gamma 1 [Hondaea fermentalgiana]|uniref:Elongation factor 1-gamma 1 n=1 Tax=Hondaea fermentalgiana TaxID=2315210 RepID=A0A2R5GB59_9STRA|nr:Elongation factor 1-gamma 1 [Hondaea fermentalgiana]|eukprot:GBG25793.1 Elongation factor 1-gamma 1 [Hondaea fermentalgiana]